MVTTNRIAWKTESASLWHGDSSDWLATLETNSADAMVTDPPAGIGFMGKEWDKEKGGREGWVSWLTGVMVEARRVLKPGGHALVWALPRTSHWTAWALENAGFEVRDRVSHFFGTGFPKSMDVGKAIDKAAGAEREAVGRSPNWRDAKRDNGLSMGSMTGENCGMVTAPATDAAKQWDGWGTALKPACEDWWLVRKPLEGTVAKNVLAHGTGALNVDGCRVEGAKPATTRGAGGQHGVMSPLGGQGRVKDDGKGRWPANITLDPEAAAVLDGQSGFSKSSDAPRNNGDFKSVAKGYDKAHTTQGHSDSGGASRFFYVAKPSRREKEAGLDDLPAATGGEATGRKDGSAGLESPRSGAGRGGGRRNTHPTVKSIELMRWLCRLVTPPGGLIIDPFAGSGTTGCAAMVEGFRFAGADLDEHHIAIASRRIDHWERARAAEGLR